MYAKINLFVHCLESKKKKKKLKEDDHKLFLKDHSENKMEPIFAYFNF